MPSDSQFYAKQTVQSTKASTWIAGVYAQLSSLVYYLSYWKPLFDRQIENNQYS